MDLVNYFDHHDRKGSKEHFINLVQAASVDGVIDTSESNLLHRIGRRLGFTVPEIDKMIENRETKIFTPPYELEKRCHQLYDIVAMALADGVLDASEIRLIKRLAIASYFNESEVDSLITMLVNGIEKGKDEDDLFQEFKKKR